MKGQWHGGKGATPRKEDMATYDANFKQIFGKKDDKHLEIPIPMYLNDLVNKLNDAADKVSVIVDGVEVNNVKFTLVKNLKKGYAEVQIQVSSQNVDDGK